MKNQGTYEGFDFNKKWTISPEDNNGYPYYNPQTEEITLKVQASTEPKVWSTSCLLYTSPDTAGGYIHERSIFQGI